ncbi:1622_t:CDS:2, partial [Gigaspora rosea]
TLQALVEQYDPMIETVNIADINNQNLDYFETKKEQLDHVRNMILNEEKSNSIQFDYFVSKTNEPILHEEESNTSLETILRPSIRFIFKDDLIENAEKINKNSTISECFNYEEEKTSVWIKSKESSKQTLKNQTTTDIFITKFKRAEIFISKEYVILTEEFKKKIENALDSLKSYHEIVDDLREITKTYG